MRNGNKSDAIIEFNDCEILIARHVLSEHESIIRWLEPVILDGKHHLVSASHDETIKVWDLTDNTVVATLTGHNEAVYALALYDQTSTSTSTSNEQEEDKKMLVSGSVGGTLMFWNLSSLKNTNTTDVDVNSILEQTVTGHKDTILSMEICERENQQILITGSGDTTIKVWKLEDYSLITTFTGHENYVTRLCVYYDIHDNGKPYLASGSVDESIKIWSLDDYSLVKTLDEDVNEIRSLVLVNLNNDNDDDDEHQTTIASGDSAGNIKLWSTKDFSCIQTIKAKKRSILTLEAVRLNGKLCLACPGDDKSLKLWDLQSSEVIESLKHAIQVPRVKAFMNGDEPCLASGDVKGNIKLWMK